MDPGSNRIVAAYPLPGEEPRRVFTLASAVWVATGTVDGTLVKIDPSTGAVISTVPLGPYVGNVAPGGNVIWVANYGSLLRIDPVTARFIDGPVRIAKSIRATQMVAGEGGVWFSGYDPSNSHVPDVIQRFNPSSGKIRASTRDSAGPIAIAVAPGGVWVLNYDGSIMRVPLGR